MQKFTSSESINKDYLALKMRKLGVEASKNMMVTLIYTEGSPINLYSYLEFNINQKVIYQDNDDILLIFNGNNFDEKLDNIIKIMNNKKN